MQATSARNRFGALLGPETLLDDTIVFRLRKRIHRGAMAVDAVCALERGAEDSPYRGETNRRFLLWSLGELGDRVPPRGLDVSVALEAEEFALSYLYLLDEYGAGEPLAGRQDSAD